MPLDPSIIGSYNPGPAPDVNAMMTQAATGMQNINTLERQRQQDALDLEDRAAAQKKEQEAAAVDALIPAYVHGIENPTDFDGMAALVPPDMQANVAPYLDQIRGLPPEQVRSLLTSSLLSSDRGKAFLENQARMRTAQIQQGQLEVAQGNLALNKTKAAQEAAAGSKVAQWITDDAGNVRGLDAQGNVVVTRPGIGKKTTAAAPSGVKLGPGEVLDPKTQTVKLLEGSKEYNKQKGVHGKDFQGAINVDRQLQDIEDAVKDVMDTSGWQKTMGTGAIMGRAPNIPVISTALGGYEFTRKMRNLEGAVKALGRTDASTSGKLGNMAVQEWRYVADAIANLDLTNMGTADLNDQLNIIMSKAQEMRNSLRNGYEQEWGGSQFYAPFPETSYRNRGAAGPVETDGTRPAGVGQNWSLEQDAQGNKAWVSPDRKRFVEVD